MYIPKWILNGGDEVKKSFIASLFDDEGSVHQWSISFTFCKNEMLRDNLSNFLNNLKTMLSQLNVITTNPIITKIYKTPNGNSIEMRLQTGKMRSLKEFIRFPLSHVRKIDKLNKIINSYKTREKISLLDTQKRMIGILNDGPKTKYEIANILDRHFDTIRKLLLKLEKDDIVKRMGRKIIHNNLRYQNQPVLWGLK